MRPESIEKIRYVQEDLRDLFKDFGGADYQDSRIHRSYSSLNMLLIENNLEQAYTLAFGNLGKIKVTSPSLDIFIYHDHEKTIVEGFVGGAHL